MKIMITRTDIVNRLQTVESGSAGTPHKTVSNLKHKSVSALPADVPSVGPESPSLLLISNSCSIRAMYHGELNIEENVGEIVCKYGARVVTPYRDVLYIYVANKGGGLYPG